MSKPAAILSMLVLTLGGGKVAADVIDGEELVDPTRPFYFEVAASGETEALLDLRSAAVVRYDLSFIRASDSSPVAIINGQRVTLGDVIGDATVVAIDRSSVTLLINEEERRISLYSYSVKSPVRNR